MSGFKAALRPPVGPQDGAIHVHQGASSCLLTGVSGPAVVTGKGQAEALALSPGHAPQRPKARIPVHQQLSFHPGLCGRRQVHCFPCSTARGEVPKMDGMPLFHSARGGERSSRPTLPTPGHIRVRETRPLQRKPVQHTGAKGWGGWLSFHCNTTSPEFLTTARQDASPAHGCYSIRWGNRLRQTECPSR